MHGLFSVEDREKEQNLEMEYHLIAWGQVCDERIVHKMDQQQMWKSFQIETGPDSTDYLTYLTLLGRLHDIIMKLCTLQKKWDSKLGTVTGWPELVRSTKYKQLSTDWLIREDWRSTWIHDQHSTDFMHWSVFVLFWGSSCTPRPCDNRAGSSGRFMDPKNQGTAVFCFRCHNRKGLLSLGCQHQHLLFLPFKFQHLRRGALWVETRLAHCMESCIFPKTVCRLFM